MENLKLKEEFIYRDVEPKESVSLTRTGELLYCRGRKETRVSAKPSFPWSSPTSHISLVDEDGEVLKVIESVSDLQEKEKEAVLLNLKQSDFLFEILRVLRIEDEFELRLWEVETKQGNRVLQTSLEAWPRRLPDGSHLVEDVSGDLYKITDATRFVGDSGSQVEALIR